MELPVAVLPLEAASTSAAFSSVTVGEMDGEVFFRPGESVLERRRMNRVARLAVLGLAGPEPEGDFLSDFASSTSTTPLPWSIDERRLLMLKRRARELPDCCVDEPRDEDVDWLAAELPRLSVDGDLPPIIASVRSLKKPFMADKEDRRSARALSVDASGFTLFLSLSCDCLDSRRSSKVCLAWMAISRDSELGGRFWISTVS